MVGWDVCYIDEDDVEERKQGMGWENKGGAGLRRLSRDAVVQRGETSLSLEHELEAELHDARVVRAV